MSYVYGSRFTNQVRMVDFKKFTIARFSRVYPLHFATLVLIIFILFFFGRIGVPKMTILQVDNNAWSVVTNLLLIHSMNVHNWFTWVHASWSISTEWWAYMIFPFLVSFFFRLNSFGRVMICLACFVGYFCIMFFLYPIVKVPPELSFIQLHRSDWSINVAYQYGIVRCLCGFILGMMMHQAFIVGWGKKILGNGWVMILLALASFTSMHFNLPDIITVTFFPFLLLCGAYGSVGINRLFSTAPFQRLGDWSFSIYLVHQPILISIFFTLDYLNPPNPNQQPPRPSLLIAWSLALLFVVLILFVSYLSYRFVENPARKWLNSMAATEVAPSVAGAS
jgi:peptidoglycan/LPS O-acetylase OafA/YrhL